MPVGPDGAYGSECQPKWVCPEEGSGCSWIVQVASHHTPCSHVVHMQRREEARLAYNPCSAHLGCARVRCLLTLIQLMEKETEVNELIIFSAFDKSGEILI